MLRQEDLQEMAKQNEELANPSPISWGSIEDFKDDQCDFEEAELDIDSVSVKKPDKHVFIRVHPDENYRMTIKTLEVPSATGVGKEVFVVHPSIGRVVSKDPMLIGCVKSQRLYTTITRQNKILLWPITVEGGAQGNKWNQSALVCAKEAMDSWVKVLSDTHAGEYVPKKAPVQPPDPDWSKLPDFLTLLNRGFNLRMIDTYDHEVLKGLRGEI